MNISDYYQYSWFSNLAYVNWRESSITNIQDTIEDANNSKRVPGIDDLGEINTLGEKIFKPVADGGEGWRVADFYPDDPVGFAASLFTNDSTGEKVLGIRGTDPGGEDWQFYKDLLKEDLHEIGEYGIGKRGRIYFRAQRRQLCQGRREYWCQIARTI